MDFLQLIDGFESFLAYAVQGLIYRLRVHGFEAAFGALLRAEHFELF